MHKGTPLTLSDFSAETLNILCLLACKVLKKINKTSNQEYSAQQSCHSELKEKYRVSQIS